MITPAIAVPPSRTVSTPLPWLPARSVRCRGTHRHRAGCPDPDQCDPVAGPAPRNTPLFSFVRRVGGWTVTWPPPVMFNVPTPPDARRARSVRSCRPSPDPAVGTDVDRADAAHFIRCLQADPPTWIPPKGALAALMATLPPSSTFSASSARTWMKAPKLASLPDSVGCCPPRSVTQPVRPHVGRHTPALRLPCRRPRWSCPTEPWVCRRRTTRTASSQQALIPRPRPAEFRCRRGRRWQLLLVAADRESGEAVGLASSILIFRRSDGQLHVPRPSRPDADELVAVSPLISTSEPVQRGMVPTPHCPTRL